MAPISLQIAAGWQEIAPDPHGPELLVECDGRVKHLRSDGSEISDFGHVGPVECPLAYDPKTRTAYRYVCGADLSTKDFSRIEAFSLADGRRHPLCQLPLNHWALWLLQWLPGRGEQGGQLFGLMASDLPIEGQVCLQHRLFALDTRRPMPRFRSLSLDAYRPLAFSRARRELLFSGAEGNYLVGLDGERRATLPADQCPPSDGADFDPQGAGRAVLGAEGLHLWEPGTGSCVRLTRRGRKPVWSPNGDTIWYAGSSGELRSFRLSTGADEPVLGIRDNRFPDFWKSRSVALSPCGRYLAVMLSARRLKGVTRKNGGIEKSEKVFQEQNCFVVLKLDTARFWRLEGRFFNAHRWLGYARRNGEATTSFRPRNAPGGLRL
jgi:hypothetical protein